MGHRRGFRHPRRVRRVAGGEHRRRAGSLRTDLAGHADRRSLLPAGIGHRPRPRPVEGKPVKKKGRLKNAVRYTEAHHSLTFSRRMLLIGGAQLAIGASLIARLGYLAIDKHELYQTKSEDNR